MIRRINLLRNVGVFDNATISRELKHIVLIYAENASGKTTLAEVLRSLETGEQSAIAKKHRFNSVHKPHIVLECDGDLSTVMFQDEHWKPNRPLVRVFDEAFITDNVYSGLDVESEHRQNLHDLTLGRQGVSLSRYRKKLAQTIEQCNKDMREAKSAVPDEQRGGLSMDEFCDLDEVPDIDAEKKNAQMEFDTVQDADAVLKTPVFEMINLPAFDESAIRAILQQDLQDLDAEAAAGVARHIKSLGGDGESWIAEGMEYVSDDTKTCPFCGQATTDVSLLRHYRAYFSEAYENLKRSISDMLNTVRNSNVSNAQTTFERIVGGNKDVGHVWAKYGLQMPDIDTKPIVDDWISALNVVAGLLEAKQATPLERVLWDSNVLEPYERRRRQIEGVNNKMDAYNDEINQMKRNANSATVQSAHDKLFRLNVTKERYSPMTAAWCDKYMRARTGKDEAVEKQDQATRQLGEYRNKVFPALQKGVNHYLQLFGVRYAIHDFEPANIKGGSSCNYRVRIGNTSIGTSKPKSKNDPTIGSVLSTSDRHALALALFFSSLADDESLADTVVVVDDPMSSFDDNRSLATVQELRKLAAKAGQMIILSHKSTFLTKIWRKVGHEECLPLTIVHSDNGSTILDWNIGEESNAEQAQRQLLLEKYAKDKTEDPVKVAKAIRPYLEAVLEAMCAGHYNGSKQIGSFVGECNAKCGTADEILDQATVDELRDIVEYAGSFMHGSDRDIEVRNINRAELRTYAQRTLDVAKLSVGR